MDKPKNLNDCLNQEMIPTTNYNPGSDMVRKINFPQKSNSPICSPVQNIQIIQNQSNKDMQPDEKENNDDTTTDSDVDEEDTHEEEYSQKPTSIYDSPDNEFFRNSQNMNFPTSMIDGITNNALINPYFTRI